MRLSLILPSLLLAAAAAAALPARPEIPPQDPPEAIEDHMLAIGRNLRRLRREISDPAKKEAVLDRLVTMQLAATQARALVPHIVEEAPAAERAALLQEYRLMQIAFLRSMLDLEEAVVRGDQAAIEKKLAEVVAWQDKGHAKFNPENHH